MSDYNNAKNKIVVIIFSILVIILLILLFPILKSIYNWYIQIDSNWIKILLLSIIIIGIIIIYIILKNKNFIFKSKYSKNKYNNFGEFIWGFKYLFVWIIFFIIIIFIFFIISCFYKYPKKLNNANIVITNFDELVTQPKSFSFQGLGFSNDHLNPEDFLYSFLRNKLINLGICNIKIAISNKKIKNIGQAENFLTSNKNFDAIIWGTSIIYLSSYIIQFCPVVTYRDFSLDLPKTNIEIEHSTSTYETIIDIGKNKTKFRELDAWIEFLINNSLFNNKRQPLDKEKNEIILENTLNYFNLISDSLKKPNYFKNEHYIKLKEKFNDQLSRFLFSSKGSNLKDKIGSNINTTSFHYYFNQSAHLIKKALKEDSLRYAIEAKRHWQEAIISLDKAMEIKPRNFMVIFYKYKCALSIAKLVNATVDSIKTFLSSDKSNFLSPDQRQKLRALVH